MAMLAKGMASRGHSVRIVTIFPGGQVVAELLEAKGVELVSLWSSRSEYILFRIFQLIISPLLLRHKLKDVDRIYSMLEVTNFIAWAATRFKRNTYLVWGIRSSHMEGHWKMAMFDKLCIFVSRGIRLLITNSHAGLQDLLKRGYRPQHYKVIPNGIDTERFEHNEESRIIIRHELGVSPDQPLVGIVGRLNPMKGHPTFLEAAALAAEKRDDVRFVCVGGGPDNYTNELYTLANKLGLNEKVFWSGDRNDVADIYSALDVLVSSSSYGEGFSNVIAEAMACGLPCVVTDVGDSARIVGETGRVVPAGNASLLATEILGTLDQLYNGLVKKDVIRQRIENNYSVDSLLVQTEMVL